MQPRIIAIGPGSGPLEKVAPALGRPELEVHRVESAAEALTLCAREGADLVLLSLPLVDMRLAEFVGALRRECDPTRSPRLAVLAATDELEPLADIDADLVPLATEHPEERLQTLLLHLVAKVTPLPRRLWLRLEVQLGAGKILRLCQTANISASGMLVKIPEEFPLGSEVRFELRPSADEDPIRGEAEIVRYANPRVEGIRGLGIRFLRFQGEGRKRLRELLETGRERS